MPEFVNVDGVEVEVGAGSGAVDSVNGETDVVTLTAADIGSTATGDVSATDVQAAIAELAAEKATAAALAAHLADTSDAHDASAVSILDTANDFTATDVEGALAELQSDHEADVTALSDHVADGSAAHAASAVAVDSATLVGTGTDVQAVFEEIDNAIVLLAPLASPALTGNPTAPTQTAGNNSTRVATTAYADTAIATLVGTAPGVLDTLGEISDAINDDANLYTTLTTALALKAPLANPTFTGNVVVPDADAATEAMNRQASDARYAIRGVVALTDGANIATDAALGDVFKVTLGGNRTMDNPSNVVAGKKLVYRIKQDGTGTRTLTWGSAFRFSGGTAPTLTVTAAKTDYLGFIYNADDTKWDMVAAALNF